MSEAPMVRRLAAILAADVVGYSRMMGEDEVGTLAALRKVWSELFNPVVAGHRGRLVKMMGDGALVEFASAVDAVHCAVAVQKAMVARAAEKPIAFRIGVNIGDIVIEGEDIFGDGVNVAARLESQAPAGGVLLSDAIHAQVKGKVDLTFADAGEIALKNIAEPVRVWRWGGGSIPVARSAGQHAQHSQKPSIAVLPFQNMSTDPEQEFFADGLVEDILTTLSKLSGLDVIARNSSFAYKGKSVDVRQAGKELGARYVLEGSVRKGGKRIRITAQLVDAETGIHLWAERYDRAIEDIFAVQDEITLILATEMQVRLTEGEQARIRYTTTTNIEAWNLWIEGLRNDRLSRTSETRMKTRRCWERALALDPGSAALNAILADLHYSDARLGWSGEDHATALKKAKAYVERAFSIDPETPDAHRSAAGILLLELRFEEAAEAARRAAKFGPSLPDLLASGGFVLTCCGYAEEAIPQIERALALSPVIQQGWHLGVLGNAYRLAGRPADAVSAFRAFHARNPGFGLVDIVLIQHQAGRDEDARETATQLALSRPDFTIASWLRTQFRVDKEQMAVDLAALRAAGVHE